MKSKEIKKQQLIERYPQVFNKEVDTGECLLCDKIASLKCTGCNWAFYCNRDHQRKDWKNHKPYCSATKEFNNTFLVSALNHSASEKEIMDTENTNEKEMKEDNPVHKESKVEQIKASDSNEKNVYSNANMPKIVNKNRKKKATLTRRKM